MEPKDRKKSYSDLEAIITSSSSTAAASSSTTASSSSSSSVPSADRHRSYWNEKFFAGPTSPDPKRAIVNDGKAGAAPGAAAGVKSEKDSLKENSLGVSPIEGTLPPPPPSYYLVDSQGQTQALYTVPTTISSGSSIHSSASSDAGSIMNLKVGPAAAAAAPGGQQGWWASLGEGRRIFGMRKNVFLAVMAGVCALILGLLATILVVTHAGAGGRPDGDGGKGGKGGPAFSTKRLLSAGDSGPLLAASDLAALNWTDTATGTAYSGVFYQASRAQGGLALMVAFKNEKTQTWSHVNISASAAGSATQGQLDVLPGTPLAAASNNGLWNLYYLTSTMTIAEVYATDPTANNGWQQGSFSDVLNRPAVMPGSGLGAMWQSCGATCDNALFVSWQAAGSGALVYANMTNLTWGQPVVLATAAAPGTGVVVNAYTDSGPKIKTGTAHNAVRWYYADGKGMEEMIKGPLGSGKLLPGNFSMCPPPPPLVSPSLLLSPPTSLEQNTNL